MPKPLKLYVPSERLLLPDELDGLAAGGALNGFNRYTIYLRQNYPERFEKLFNAGEIPDHTDLGPFITVRERDKRGPLRGIISLFDIGIGWYVVLEPWTLFNDDPVVLKMLWEACPRVWSRRNLMFTTDDRLLEQMTITHAMPISVTPKQLEGVIGNPVLVKAMLKLDQSGSLSDAINLKAVQVNLAALKDLTAWGTINVDLEGVTENDPKHRIGDDSSTQIWGQKGFSEQDTVPSEETAAELEDNSDNLYGEQTREIPIYKT